MDRNARLAACDQRGRCVVSLTRLIEPRPIHIAFQLKDVEPHGPVYVPLKDLRMLRRRAGQLLVPNGSNLAVANEGVTTSWFSFFREPSFCSLPDAAASGARGIIQKTIAT